MIVDDCITCPNGWHHQTDRLLATHAALGTGIISAARCPSTSTTISRQMPLGAGAGYCPTAGEGGAAPVRSPSPQRSLLERQVARGTSVKPDPSDQTGMLTAQVVPSFTEAENDFDPAVEDLVRRDNEIRSLRASLELALSENGRLSERLEERDVTFSELKRQFEQHVAFAKSETKDDAVTDATDQTNVGGTRGDHAAETVRLSLNCTQDVERGDLATVLNEMNKHRELETSAFLNQLNAMLSRATSAEERLAETQCNLLSLSKESNAAITEHLRLSTGLAERDLELRAARCKLDREKTMSIAIEIKNCELTLALEKTESARLEDVGSLTSKLQAMKLRATEAEALLVEMRLRLSEKLEVFQRSLDSKSCEFKEVVSSRTILVAGLSVLLRRINASDNARSEAESTGGLLPDPAAELAAAPDVTQVRSARALLAGTMDW